MSYRAPVAEYRFFLDHVVELAVVAGTDRFAEATPETVDAILTEAGRLCEEVVAPMQRVGDTQGSRLENGVVRTPEGFGDAFRQIAEGGWVGIAASPEHGGMGLPMMVTTAVNEMMSAACLSLQLNPLLTQGQIEALEAHASEDLARVYLPKLIAGEWSGTMNLTEPQAGSDVGALRTKAESLGDGSYAVTGQKIYISWGDADFVDNVCHLVLARLPDAAPGTKGISLFLVPKRIPDADGNAGVANDLRVISLEHKLGLHGSPTAVMSFEGARGWLVGEPHRGMAAMFTMMNNARLGVGVQGIGVAEGAYQHALGYALDRRQGEAEGTGSIAEHADVRRMLTRMRAETCGARAIALACAQAIDMSTATGDAAWKARAALLTPIAKAWGTEVGIAVAGEGIQVHGGMGFVEETGAAQFSRDVRVTAIYEGTNGIQAMDLVGRKMMDGGEAATALAEEIERGAETARRAYPEMAEALWEAAAELRETTEWIVTREPRDRFAGAVPYLKGFARVLAGHYLLRAALAEGGEGPRTHLAAFYIGRMLPEHAGLLAEARAGSAGLYALTLDDLAA